MKNLFIISFFVVFICNSVVSQYYDTSAMNVIHTNKTGYEGDMYLDTVNKVYRIGLTNGELGYLHKGNAIDSVKTVGTSDLVLYYFDGTSDTVDLAGALGQAWNINGNSGINHSVNFMGTTTNRDLPFRTNNAEKMRLFKGAKPALGIGLTTTSGINGGASSFSGPTIFLGNAANLSSPTGYDFVIDHDNNSTSSKFRIRANGDGAPGTKNLLVLKENGDLFLVGYPNTRTDNTTAHLNSLYTDATGNVQSARREIIPASAYLQAGAVSVGNTFNYYTHYSSALTVNGLTPIAVANLDFYVFSYDASLFANVTISALGVLTYDIIATSTVRSVPDIRFYTK